MGQNQLPFTLLKVQKKNSKSYRSMRTHFCRTYDQVTFLIGYFESPLLIMNDHDQEKFDVLKQTNKTYVELKDSHR